MKTFTLLSLLLCLAAVSFHCGIAIAFPDHHLLIAVPVLPSTSDLDCPKEEVPNSRSCYRYCSSNATSDAASPLKQAKERLPTSSTFFPFGLGSAAVRVASSYLTLDSTITSLPRPLLPSSSPSSNSYIQPTPQHHLLSSFPCIDVGSLISIQSSRQNTLVTLSAPPSTPLAALPFSSPCFSRPGEPRSSSSVQVSLQCPPRV